jgi:iron complex outermembrane receptor protein
MDTIWCTRRRDGGRWRRAVPGGVVAVLVVLGFAMPVAARPRVNVTIVPDGPARVTFAAGTDAAEIFEIRGGALTVELRASGEQTVTVEFGGQTYTGRVELPDSGQVQLIFDPGAPQVLTVYAVALEEITVSAERVEANLQKVPIAVTALTSRDLEERRILNIQQVSYQTPNLWMEKNTGTSSGSRAAIRGIGEDESFFTSDTPVGIYIDDVYIPRQTGAQFDLFEVERIEVLRGPQGTLYGRNTSAGAIKIVTRQPDSRPYASIEGIFGSYAQADLRGSVTVPLAGARASLQVAGMRRGHRGYDVNVVDGRRVNDQDVRGGRAAMRLMPRSSLNVLISGDYIEERSTPGYALGLVPQPPLVNGVGMGPQDLRQQVDGDRNVRTLASDLTNPLNTILQRGLSATVSYGLGSTFVLKSVTAYRNLYNLLLLDADGQVGNNTFPAGTPAASLPIFHLFQDQSQRQWSHELQLSGSVGPRVRLIGGYFYFHERNAQITENLIFRATRGGNYSDVTLETDSHAVYGSLSVQPVSRLSVTVGSRYTRDTKDYAHRLLQPSGAPALACVGPTGAFLAASACPASAPTGARLVPVERFLKPDFDGFTPRFAVDYAVTPEHVVYASASRGFKSGAFDGRNMTPAAILVLEPIAPENLWSYEGGLKSDWFRNRLRLNVSAFYNTWNDLQGSGTDQSGNFRRFSIGDVTTKGVEIETRAVPAPGLELTGQLSVLRTAFSRVNFNQAVDCAPFGTGSKKLELKYSPHQSYSVGARYTLPAPVAGGTWSVSGTVSGKTKFFHTACNAEAGSEDGYALGDLAVSYETARGAIRITAAIENLWDEQYKIGSFTFGAPLRFQSVFLNPPRRATVSVRYAFR